jgi:outer membrane receptor protein involved in Fe transport
MKISLGLLLGLCLLVTINGLGQDSSYNELNTVVVTANKFITKRVESPIAISIISQKLIQETRPARMDFLLNRVSGVYMPSIGNEQHMMAIRQPISLKGLYLYLEDGMPIRTSGLFSNNALIEINNSAIQQIEIIKGPASALYGSEAIGGVINVITRPAPSINIFNISGQANSLGLKKADINVGFPVKKGGWMINLSWASQLKGPIDYSDFSKKAISVKHDFNLGAKLSGYNSLQYIDYFAQMTGSVDSIHYNQHDFNSLQSFTFRKINALRFRQYLSYKWSKSHNTILNLMYRNNRMDQNPTYSIASTNNPVKYKGQTNQNKFNAYVLELQHIINLEKIKSKIILGVNKDITGQNLKARYIDIIKDTVIGKYTNYAYPSNDSILTNYKTKINNSAAYINVISSITNDLKANIALRYDHFEYDFNNSILNGTPSSNNIFNSLTPKLGLTYNKYNKGVYLNFSEGFVPPQITEIYNAIRVPYLLPQSFNNIEIGGWYVNDKWYTEISIYQLLGMNEIISVRQTDGINLNQNSGSTKHVGIEYQIKYKASKKMEFNWSASLANHSYTNTTIKGTDVSGKEMNAAPAFWSNLSAIWKLNNKLNCSLEWQHQSEYFMDETNATKYPGFDVINYRLNYKMNKSELWMHVLNATNTYYSTMATKNFSIKGNAAYSYYIGEPRSIALGWTWTIKGPY